eukprot:13333484-Ditylum_brightwellii.AAC.1
MTERSKQNTHVVCNKNNGVDNIIDDSVTGSDKHLTHLSQADDCHLIERSKQFECVDGETNNGVNDCVDNSGDHSDDSGNKQFGHLTLSVDYHLRERSKQN